MVDCFGQWPRESVDWVAEKLLLLMDSFRARVRDKDCLFHYSWDHSWLANVEVES